MHPNCDAHRWTMQGSRATHCGYCDPPLPMSPKQSERIGRMFAGFPEWREEELDIWERTLTCGHTTRQSVHHTNRSPQRPDPMVLHLWGDPRGRDFHESRQRFRAEGSSQTKPRRGVVAR